MIATERKAECPNCGGPIEFKLGSSAALVCPFCRFGVVRTDRDLASLGKVADLVPTAPLLAVGDRGEVNGRELVVGGRLQLDHGKGPWDEWYVELTREQRWGWLAYAQGHWYLTFAIETSGVPPWNNMTPGAAGKLPGAGDMDWTVAERGRSTVVSAEGELPFAPQTRSPGGYVDLAGPNGKFATIDYGDGTSAPKLFVGEQVANEAVRIERSAVGPRPEQHVDTARLRCPGCGGPLPIFVPDQTEHAACPSCQALVSFEQGALRHLRQLDQPRIAPLVPLGTKGRVGDLDCLCIGMMERFTVFEGVTYAWREYLLHTPRGFRWLVEDNGNWLFVEPLNVADVQMSPSAATYSGRKYKPFSTATTKVRFVTGEFYWRVEVGESAYAVDYIAPPHLLSEERSSNEINWSHGTYMTGRDVWRAFKLDGSPPRVNDVAPAQPNPVDLRAPTAIWLATTMLLFIVYFATSPSSRSTLLVQGPVTMPAAPDRARAPTSSGTTVGSNPKDFATLGIPAPSTIDPLATAVSFTPTFYLPRGANAVEIEMQSDMTNGWLGVACALINEDTQTTQEIAIEQDYFYEGATSTVFGRLATERIVGLTPGNYVLRLDPRWVRNETTLVAAVAPNASVTVRTVDARSGSPQCCAVATFMLFLPLLFALSRRSTFEKRRWWNSNVGSGNG